jgi:Phage integrase family
VTSCAARRDPPRPPGARRAAYPQVSSGLSAAQASQRRQFSARACCASSKVAAIPLICITAGPACTPLIDQRHVGAPARTQCASFVIRPTSRPPLKVEDVAPNGYAIDRATVRQKKTGRPVKFELTDQTRQAVDNYLKAASKKCGELLFTGRRGIGQGMTTRQYARLVSEWVACIGLDPKLFGTHSLRRTKATLIYRRTGNLRAVQLLLGHTKIESTVRYLGIGVDDALSIAEQVDV